MLVRQYWRHRVHGLPAALARPRHEHGLVPLSIGEGEDEHAAPGDDLGIRD